MPIKSGHRGARRRDTQLPMAFVNNNRRRGRSPQRQRMGQLTEESSVVMHSSVENTLIPVAGSQDESSELMASMDGDRRSRRPSTRLTDVDMILDETGNSMQSWKSKSFTSNGTNMSIINVDQTTMIEHERAKSSVLPRWTRSKSLAPVGVEQDADGIRRSSIFSMVTKRNRRRGRSVVRNSSREEMVRSNSPLGERHAGQGMDLSQISEEQQNSSGTGSVAGNPKPFVKELVIQTRSMLKKGKRWSPARTKTRYPSKTQPDKPSKEKDDNKQASTQNKRGRKRKQKQPTSEVAEELPVREHGKEAQPNEKTPLVSLVTRRKRRESNREQRTPEETSIVDANQNVSSTSKEQLEADESVANSATSRLDSLSDQSKSNPLDNSQFSNVSKRKRPKPIPDKAPEVPKESVNPGENVHEASASESEPTMKRARTRSVSRARQPTQEPKKSTENRGRTRSRQTAPEQINLTTHEPEKSAETRGRSRKRAISESAKIAPFEPIMTRHRSKSVLRTEITKPKSRSRARSRTRTLTAKPGSPKAGGTPSRSKSVPRGILSPPPANPNHTTDHVPIYRRYAEQVLQLNRSVLPRPDAIPLPPGEDVYMFDLPSQDSTTTTTASSSDDTKKTKGSTAKKRPRLATSVSSRSRKTPVKHHTTVFGTDMGKICSVVKKIGGGLVQRMAEDGGTSANRNVVHTSTLAAMVQSLQPSNALNIAPRSPSPAVSTHDMAVADDHHHDYEDEGHHDFDEENIPTVELPTPLSPPRLNPQIQRVLQRQPPPTVNTPDKAQPHSSTPDFSPQASSSPWRVQNENILPKTFYYSRSKDQLPSYESDLVVRNENHQTTVNPQDILPVATEPVHPKRTSPKHQHSFVRPTAVPPTAVSSAVFKDIQKSYEQLKATSEMSDKLITAMRKYKSNVQNQTAASFGDDSTAEELIARFRKYEENMKQTYQKLQQWFKRSQRTLADSMKAIEQTSSVPKTPAQLAVVENFRRNSERFVTMINDLESAMNDSNIENISPSKPVEIRGRPPFKDIILTERNRNDRNRSPLKTLDITNVPPRFSPINSPLVKASFTSFSGNRTMLQSKSRDRFSKLSLIKPSPVPIETERLAAVPAAAKKSVIEIADTVVEDHPAINEVTKQQPEKDLFGFETDDEQEEEASGGVPPVEPTPMKITRETLKERLQSVRKLLPTPGRFGSASKSPTIQQRSQQHAPRIFNSPQRKKVQSIQNAFSASTPLAEKRNQPKGRGEQDPNISAIRTSTDPTMEVEQAKKAAGAPRRQESPPAALFDEPELANVSRTYSRVPRRNLKRKPNIYLVNLGISDDDEEEEPDPEAADSDDWTEQDKGKKRKKAKKQRAPTQKRKKKTVEQSAEFKNYVSEFNSMCDQVNRYQLVIEKPTVQQPV
ncbi:serine/arginine repetitive matrix protein 2-like [Ochlerotatus camptorhynchus]|uniref:serine/arginine repetitive matrix protein 2-like n=1 Tax=Ochlerotatus camptorhynchus TaxID=644619 RepID=UPI0031D1A922